MKMAHIVVTSKEKSEGCKEFQILLLQSKSYNNMDKVGM